MNEEKLRLALAKMHQEGNSLGPFEALIFAENLMNKAATGDREAQQTEQWLQDWAGRIIVAAHSELLERYKNKVL